MMDWLDAGGISLRYQLRGDAAHTAVFVHEAGGCLESWDGVIAALAGRLRTLSYDARGAGLSEKPRTPLSIDCLVGDLLHLLDGLQILVPVTLVGCAVGAAVALRLAATHPSRVARLVALSPATGIAEADRARTLALATRIETDGVRARVLERFAHSYAADYFSGRTDRSQVLARLLHADPTSYAQLFRMLCDLDLSGDLARIRAPSLIVAGRRDGTRPPHVVEQVARVIPAARFEILESGHAMNILTPTLVAEALVRFLDADTPTCSGPSTPR
jgi:3-oxoadipate enol-lactonase